MIDFVRFYFEYPTSKAAKFLGFKILGLHLSTYIEQKLYYTKQ